MTYDHDQQRDAAEERAQAEQYRAEQEWPAHVLPRSLTGKSGRCRFCRLEILWGTTQRGKPAPFDVAEPHPNHWVTCEERQRAREALPRRR